jgi:hypothetical protein
MSGLDREHRFTKARKLLICGVLLVFVGSLGLRVWTSGVYCRELPTPAAAHFSPVLLQACAWENGVHFLAMYDRGTQQPFFQFGRGTNLGRSGYHHGAVLSALGLAFAVLPTSYRGSDYVVPAHVALALPYWFLMLASGWLVLSFTGAVRWMKRHRPLSRRSVRIGGVVLAAFFLLNVVPAVPGLSGTTRMAPFTRWVTLTFAPWTVRGEVLLWYGFPSVFLRRAMFDGRAVDSFRGYILGCEQHLLMENVLVALLAAVTVMMVTEWLRRRINASRSASSSAGSREDTCRA